MATVEKDKEQQTKDAATNETGCCGGASKEAAKVEEKKGEACGTSPLDVKVEKKDKEHGSSCCG